MNTLQQMAVRLLRKAVSDIEAGNSELSDAEAIDLMSAAVHRAISKEQACSYLNMSRSKFDALVLEGILPKGRKRVGFKEKVWYQDELDVAVKKHRDELK